MPNPTLTTAVEKIQPTAIIKLDGAFNDFHAKEVIGIIDDLLAQDFVHFIIILKKIRKFLRNFVIFFVKGAY